MVIILVKDFNLQIITHHMKINASHIQCPGLKQLFLHIYRLIDIKALKDSRAHERHVLDGGLYTVL